MAERQINRCLFLREISEKDAEGNSVLMSVYQHPSGGIFAMDSSFLDQCCDDDSYPILPDPFSDKYDSQVMLLCE